MTYSGDPSTSSLDAVRFLIGDTVVDAEQFTDAEITWQIAETATIREAAAAACEALAAKYARQVSKTVGAMKLEAQQRFEHYRDLAKTLRVQDASLGASFPIPSAPGLSIQTKRDHDEDEDLVQPVFRRGDPFALPVLEDVR